LLLFLDAFYNHGNQADVVHAQQSVFVFSNQFGKDFP
jgi:hypothetical protein